MVADQAPLATCSRGRNTWKNMHNEWMACRAPRTCNNGRLAPSLHQLFSLTHPCMKTPSAQKVKPILRRGASVHVVPRSLHGPSQKLLERHGWRTKPLTRQERRNMVRSIETSVRMSKPNALKLGRCRNTAPHSHPMYRE